MLGEPYAGDNYDKTYIDTLLDKLLSLGASEVVLTGVSFEPDKVGVATLSHGQKEYFFTKRIPGYYHGTGDIYASALLANYCRNGGKLHLAASKAAEFTLHCIEKKLEIGGEARYGVPFELCLNELSIGS